MLGHPKYNLNDKVSFKIRLDPEKEPVTMVGTVYIIDKYGTFEDDSDVSYDIMTELGLFKHIQERGVSAVDE